MSNLRVSGDASTSLVPEGESVLTRCPRTPFDLVCREVPALRFPAGCDTWRCEWCGPRLARRRTGVLTWAEPERFVTLTQAPDEWQPLRQKVRKLALALRSAGYRVEWAWTVERGSKTGMIHVHALQHGDFVPQRELAKLWGRRVDVRRIGRPDGASLYSLKEARRVAGYTTKGTAASLAEHLALNGGRAYHLSRRYLRGLRTRDVEAIMDGVDKRLTWIVVPAVTLLDAGAAIAAAT